MIFPLAARLCLGPAPLLAVNIPTDWCWRGPAPSHTHNGVFTTTWELCPRQKVMNFQSHFSNISPGKTAINLGNCLSSGPLIIVNGDPQPSTAAHCQANTFLASWLAQIPHRNCSQSCCCTQDTLLWAVLTRVRSDPRYQS